MDVPDRDSKEARLGRIVGRLLSEQLTRLLEEVVTDDDAVDLNNLPADFWDQEGERFLRALSPEQQSIFMDQAELMLGETTIGVDWGLVNERAAAWAQRYTYDLVTGINQTSRSTLQQVIRRAFEEPLTQGELRRQLAPTFGPVRAEMIARTEVTRAAVDGERAFVSELEKMGVQMVSVWQTREDERVCPICGPLSGQRADANGSYQHPGGALYDKPPAHPRCRCWENHEPA